ncbi:MAG: transcription antitermination factor NusB [Patescibacteria group bacterium]
MADPRHIRRMKTVQNLFAQIFHAGKDNLPNEYEETVDQIMSNKEAIDTLISANAPRYPIERIAKIDLCILRLAIFELIIEKKEPPKVIIDEAVRLAREFGGDRSYAFINAVLGAIYKDETGKEALEKKVERS